MNLSAETGGSLGRAAAPEAFDLVVLGAGVGGLTAALVAALEGMSVLVLERGAQVGGTSARSSGTVWIPDNPSMRRAGMTDDALLALQYLEALAGARSPLEMRETYVREGPRMLEYLAQRVELPFQPYPAAPDYRQDLPGAAQGWRPLEPLAFDGRRLGRHFDEVAWPLPELMLFGGMMVTRGEAARLLKLGTNLDSFWLGLRLVARFAWDRLRWRRGTRLVLGNALVARLYRHVLDQAQAGRAAVWLGADALAILRTGGRVSGLRVRHAGREVSVTARKGVVMAGGGFPAGAALRERYLPSPVATYTAAAEGCTGDTLELAQQAGAALGPPGEDNALWFPSSIATRKDGSTAVYPHIVLDRAKPGLVAVNAEGRRFVDEAVSYHEFTRAMYRAHRRVPCIPAWLVCDRRFVWRYGLGMIRPRTPFLRRYVQSGYVQVADTVEELARRIGVDPAGLAETVRLHNAYALTGTDPDFGKGSTTYDRAAGDATHGPNPCLGPIARAPFCAVSVVPTPLGTSLGLLTDVHGQVLDEQRRPIPGLYACGNDMHSAFGGEYPGAGAQLGLAMTFGYLAALRAARGG
jgi:succinate dehydrogenase/fumarate reductase flavoprotein subunit